MKFDRGWLFPANDDEETSLRQAVFEYALSFSRRFALTTVLEGVETPEHLELARRYGFDCVQGFLFKDQFFRRTGERRKPARDPLAGILEDDEKTRDRMNEMFAHSDDNRYHL